MVVLREEVVDVDGVADDADLGRDGRVLLGLLLVVVLLVL